MLEDHTYQENNIDEEDQYYRELFGFDPFRFFKTGIITVGVIGLAAIIGLSSMVKSDSSKTKKRDYSELTNKVYVTAQPGDTLSGLMMKYSGHYPKGHALYQWQLDNDRHPTENLSSGKTYVFRTTNQTERTK